MDSSSYQQLEQDRLGRQGGFRGNYGGGYDAGRLGGGVGWGGRSPAGLVPLPSDGKRRPWLLRTIGLASRQLSNGTAFVSERPHPQ
jgi:hypothetical protein